MKQFENAALQISILSGFLRYPDIYTLPGLLTGFGRACHNRLMKTNLIQKTTEFALHIVEAYVHPGDTVIDATCGNGFDTLRLAEMLRVDAKAGDAADAKAGDPKMISGRLYAFDIQPEAVEATRELLRREGYGAGLPDGAASGQADGADHPGRIGGDSSKAAPGRITVACLGHQQMLSCFEGLESMPEASAIVFNLGYLPGGDKQITTTTETTLDAVRDSLRLLKVNGLLCITMYDGHPEGAEEKRALLHFAEELDSKLWHVSYISMLNQRNAPPEILLITRKR